MAGFETSAQVIGYAIWQLARHLELQQQLREEVTSILNPTFDDYSSKMPLLDAVVKERYALLAPLQLDMCS
jgi:cytochrome P450